MYVNHRTGGKHILMDTVATATTARRSVSMTPVADDPVIDTTLITAALQNQCSFIYPDRLCIYPVDEALLKRLQDSGYVLTPVSKGEYAVAVKPAELLPAKVKLQEVVGEKVFVQFAEIITMQGTPTTYTRANYTTNYLNKTLTAYTALAVECNRLNDPYAHPANNGT